MPRSQGHREAAKQRTKELAAAFGRRNDGIGRERVPALLGARIYCLEFRRVGFDKWVPRAAGCCWTGIKGVRVAVNDPPPPPFPDSWKEKEKKEKKKEDA
jgi:hypothetical protein